MAGKENNRYYSQSLTVWLCKTQTVGVIVLAGFLPIGPSMYVCLQDCVSIIIFIYVNRRALKVEIMSFRAVSVSAETLYFGNFRQL